MTFFILSMDTSVIITYIHSIQWNTNTSVSLSITYNTRIRSTRKNYRIVTARVLHHVSPAGQQDQTGLWVPKDLELWFWSHQDPFGLPTSRTQELWESSPDILVLIKVLLWWTQTKWEYEWVHVSPQKVSDTLHTIIGVV